MIIETFLLPERYKSLIKQLILISIIEFCVIYRFLIEFLSICEK